MNTKQESPQPEAHHRAWNGYRAGSVNRPAYRSRRWWVAVTGLLPSRGNLILVPEGAAGRCALCGSPTPECRDDVVKVGRNREPRS